MAKIPKNLSDSDMMSAWEKGAQKEEKKQAGKAQAVKLGYESGFLTPELTQAVGKALLELKVKLYKEGIVDYNIKVKLDGNQVVLKAVPRKSKPEA